MLNIIVGVFWILLQQIPHVNCSEIKQYNVMENNESITYRDTLEWAHVYSIRWIFLKHNERLAHHGYNY